jgi:hypothetical protein
MWIYDKEQNPSDINLSEIRSMKAVDHGDSASIKFMAGGECIFWEYDSDEAAKIALKSIRLKIASKAI